MNRAEFNEIVSHIPDDFKDHVYIYVLIDPETGEYRYIGKSIRPIDRLSNHVNEPPTHCHRSHWIQSLKRRGLRPDMLLLERVEGAWPWQESERYWIAYGRAHGWPLTNNTDGGDGVSGLPEETRKKMAATWKGRKHRPETIEKLIAARRARGPHSAETRAKMRAAHAGRVITWGAKISEATLMFSVEQEAEIRRRALAGESVVELGKEYGAHRGTITKIKLGRYRRAAAE